MSEKASVFVSFPVLNWHTLTNTAHRMCSGINDVLAFPSNFIDNLLGTSSQQWTREMKHRDTDIFDTLCVNMHFRNNFVYVVNEKPPITCKRCFDYEIEVVNLVYSIISM